MSEKIPTPKQGTAPTPASRLEFAARLRAMRPKGCETIEGGVAGPCGFTAAGVAAGIKRAGLDVALIVSDRPCQAAGVFTRNIVCAAPVVWTKNRLGSLEGKPHVRCIVINAGCANACTGDDGMEAVRVTAACAERTLGLPDGACLVASTGVIGKQLPREAMLSGVAAAGRELSGEGGHSAAQAIMTTDTVPKEIAVEVTLSSGKVRIGGMAKGSGMIHPDMATLLAFITTDAALGMSDEELTALLRQVADVSFNSMTVDNDTSTNDTFLLLANGASGLAVEKGTADWNKFTECLKYVAKCLAMLIAGDGEGATKLFEVAVSGASSDSDARRAAMAVAQSCLVKTAIFGADANWGRIICALGYSGAEFNPYSVDIDLGSIPVCRGGAALEFDEVAAKAALEESWICTHITLGSGAGEATVWTCDLTDGYIDINASYRS